MSLSSKVVNFVLAHDGRKKDYSDHSFFEEHLEEMRRVNSEPYVMPKGWDFGVPTEKVSFGAHDCYILNGGKEDYAVDWKHFSEITAKFAQKGKNIITGERVRVDDKYVVAPNSAAIIEFR